MNSIEADMRLIRDLLVARREQLTATLEQPATKARDDQVRILRDSIDIIQMTRRANMDSLYRRQQ